MKILKKKKIPQYTFCFAQYLKVLYILHTYMYILYVYKNINMKSMFIHKIICIFKKTNENYYYFMKYHNTFSIICKCTRLKCVNWI